MLCLCCVHVNCLYIAIMLYTSVEAHMEGNQMCKAPLIKAFEVICYVLYQYRQTSLFALHEVSLFCI
jgi:hypothetical protein